MHQPTNFFYPWPQRIKDHKFENSNITNNESIFENKGEIVLVRD